MRTNKTGLTPEQIGRTQRYAGELRAWLKSPNLLPSKPEHFEALCDNHPLEIGDVGRARQGFDIQHIEDDATAIASLWLTEHVPMSRGPGSFAFGPPPTWERLKQGPTVLLPGWQTERLAEGDQIHPEDVFWVSGHTRIGGKRAYVLERFDFDRFGLAMQDFAEMLAECGISDAEFAELVRSSLRSRTGPSLADKLEQRLQSTGTSR